MKKILISIILILMLLWLAAERVSQSEATSIANGFLAEKTSCSLASVSRFPAGVNDYDEVDFYVVRFEPQGFVLIAGDTRSLPILGYSAEGSFPEGDLPEHVAWFLSHYSLAMDEIRSRNDLAVDPSWQEMKSGNYSSMRHGRDVTPLMSTRWNQDWPYNSLCPAAAGGPGGHVYAGCVATAMAQIMKKWNHPVTGTGSHSYNTVAYGTQTANFGDTTYNWAQMPNIVYSVNTHVSTIIYHCAVAVNMNFSPTGSGATINGARNAFVNYFRFYNTAMVRSASSYTATAWANMLREDIDVGRPIFYTGTGSGSGHAFVLDGYQGTSNFHINWGWSGTYDGYFALTNLNPGTNNFNQGQQAIIGLDPMLGIQDDLEATMVTGPNQVYVNQNTTYTATITNNGAQSQNSYTVKLMRSPNIQLASASGIYIPVGETVQIPINWVPSQAGNYSIFTKVILNGDQEALNNQSPPISIVVNPMPSPPHNIIAEETPDGLLNLSWETPIPDAGAWMHYDVSDAVNEYGMGSFADFEVAIRFPITALTNYVGMSLQAVKVWPVQEGTFFIRVWTGGNASSPGTLVLNQRFIPELNTYNTVVLDTPITILSNQELWIGYNLMVTGGYPVGCDEGPAVNGFGNMLHLPTGWTTLSQVIPAMDFNWCIRGYIGNYVPNQAPAISLGDIDRGLSGYKIWRLHPRNETIESLWTLITPEAINQLSYQDSDWEGLVFGDYKWAIKAVYDDQLSSVAAFSNTLFKSGDIGTLTGRITSLLDEPIEGASITCDEYSCTSDANGMYSMMVISGSYSVTASHPVYESLTQENITIVFGQTTTLDFELAYSSSPLEEDFESYEAFSFDLSPWLTMDMDGESTYGLPGISWPHQYDPQSYMVFAPSATTPPMPNLFAHSGSQMAVCFASSTPPNNDWLISREIMGARELSFWARSYSASVGLERFRVGISINGSHPDFFFFISGENDIQPPIAWTRYVYDLAPFSHTLVRIGIQCVSQGTRFLMIDDILIDTITDASEPDVPAIDTRLFANYPNPFNPSTRIPFSIGSAGYVSLGIYNVKGQKVRGLVQDSYLPGSYSASWNGRDDRGHEVSSGLYYAVLRMGQTQQKIKMMLVK